MLTLDCNAYSYPLHTEAWGRDSTYHMESWAWGMPASRGWFCMGVYSATLLSLHLVLLPFVLLLRLCVLWQCDFCSTQIGEVETEGTYYTSPWTFYRSIHKWGTSTSGIYTGGSGETDVNPLPGLMPLPCIGNEKIVVCHCEVLKNKNPARKSDFIMCQHQTFE